MAQNGDMMVLFVLLPVIAKVEQDFNKNYLIGSEYLQLDPTKAHTTEFIEERAEYVLSQWGAGDDPKEVEKLRGAVDSYLKIVRATPDVSSLNFLDGHVRTNQPGTGTHAFQVRTFWGNSKPPAANTAPMPEVLAKKFQRFAENGKLKILPGTVSDDYVKKELRHDNFDNFIGKPQKWSARKMMFRL